MLSPRLTTQATSRGYLYGQYVQIEGYDLICMSSSSTSSQRLKPTTGINSSFRNQPNRMTRKLNYSMATAATITSPMRPKAWARTRLGAAAVCNGPNGAVQDAFMTRTEE